MDNKKAGISVISITVSCFLIVCYYVYYYVLIYYGLSNDITHRIYYFIKKSYFFTDPVYNKILIIGLITASVLIYQPKKKKDASPINGFLLYISGISLIFLSNYFLRGTLTTSFISLLLILTGFLITSRGMIKIYQSISVKDLSDEDPFNELNETFMQTEEKIETEHSVNIPYEYKFKGKKRNGWINFVNLFRSLMIIGTPGSGKSFALIEEIIEQFINKYFTLVIYDFKFDTLSRIAYNYWIKKTEDDKANGVNAAKKLPNFYFICFDNVNKSHRCNPIDPYLMTNQTDASDAATSIMKNLNKEWIKKNDFFSRSAISFVSGLIWYLKKKSEERGENICTLPHVIILSTVNIEYLLEIMLKDLEVRNLMIPFKDALERDAGQQLAGQTASAQISLSMLANKELFYVMSGNDFRLDVNNPEDPKIVCVQNNPDRAEVYAAPIGLYINKTLQVVNKPGKTPMGLILDELPTIFIMQLRKIIDTGRSNKIAPIMGIQSLAQMVSDYGKELADVIFGNCANKFSGSATGTTAKAMSEIFGKIHQSKESQTFSKTDTTVNTSTQMQELLPVSKMANFSTGVFAGIVADTFQSPIKQKRCWGLVKPNLESKKIQNKHETPVVRSFKKEDHNKVLLSKLEIMKTLDFYNNLRKIDHTKNDYIKFYNEYIVDFSEELFDNTIQQNQFKDLVKELSLFDHLELIRLNKIGKIDNRDFIEKINSLVDQMIENSNKESILSDNFIQIIKDIDTLVCDEYFKAKGEEPTHRIFDENEFLGVTENLNNEELNAINFLNEIENSSDNSENILNLFADDDNEVEESIEENSGNDTSLIDDMFDTEYNVELNDDDSTFNVEEQ